MFLMWEVSTPCVYARWFLAHVGRHNTRLYIANGLAMLATFFVARNCLGLCTPLFSSLRTTADLLHETPSCQLPAAVVDACPALDCRCSVMCH